MHFLGTYLKGMTLVGVVVLSGAAGCGGAGDGTATVGAAARAADAAPPLARAPLRTGEILVTGPASPKAHGPFAFDGRYRVRFEQRDPSDPGVDFRGQTTFTAVVAPAADQAAGAGVTRLFEAARARGSTVVTLRGRAWVNVAFGDFPYAVRFTPERR